MWEKKTERVSVYLTPSEKEVFMKDVKESGLTVTNYLRYCIDTIHNAKERAREKVKNQAK